MSNIDHIITKFTKEIKNEIIRWNKDYINIPIYLPTPRTASRFEAINVFEANQTTMFPVSEFPLSAEKLAVIKEDNVVYEKDGFIVLNPKHYLITEKSNGCGGKIYPIHKQPTFSDYRAGDLHRDFVAAGSSLYSFSMSIFDLFHTSAVNTSKYDYALYCHSDYRFVKSVALAVIRQAQNIENNILEIASLRDEKSLGSATSAACYIHKASSYNGTLAVIEAERRRTHNERLKVSRQNIKIRDLEAKLAKIQQETKETVESMDFLEDELKQNIEELQ